MHAIWTFCSIARSKQFGPILKFVLLLVIIVLLVLWPLVTIAGSILGGALYGFLAPLVATFEAVGEGKTDEFFHCIVDGTWTTVTGSFTTVRDFTDVCFHSYFSIMHDLRHQQPPNGKPYEIRVFLLLGSFFVGLLGILVDVPVITIIALFKSPYMLFKGWHRLFHDLIGREGPFLETACVPFAGLSILLWPAVVVVSVVASILSSYFIGGYAAVVSYQESSLSMGLSYMISSLSIFDEYSNDVLDLPEGSCFPRLKYRKNEPHSASVSRASSLPQEKQDAKAPPSRTVSLKGVILEMKPLKLLDHLFSECRNHGQSLVAEGIITSRDIEECLYGKDDSSVLKIGLPAYCILQCLLRSATAGSDGLILSDGTVVTSYNRPKDTFFDWFFDPLLIMKEQIKVDNLSVEEEAFLAKLVLLEGDQERLKLLNTQSPIKDDRRRAEIDALARRLHGITKSISRYPTARRRFDSLAKALSEELGKTMDGGSCTDHPANGSIHKMGRSRSALSRFFSQKSFGSNVGRRGTFQDVEIQSADGNARSVEP